jgi:hypothetical protein
MRVPRALTFDSVHRNPLEGVAPAASDRCECVEEIPVPSPASEGQRFFYTEMKGPPTEG